MAKSKTKKMRDHLVKQGKMDPTISRIGWGIMNGVTKKPPVPSVVAERKQNKHKNKRFDHGGIDGGASYCV